MEKDSVLEMRHIYKTFPGVKALQNVDFTLKKGEIHALMGENGAGKSTLIKVLTGVEEFETGEIMIDGCDHAIINRSPQEAQNRGISTVYQEVNLCPNLTVAENLFIGREPRKGGLIDWKTMNKKASKLLQDLDIHADVTQTIDNYSIAIQQMIAIARAVDMSAKVLILDEPTSQLDPIAASDFLETVKKINRDLGTTIILTEHRLEEVFPSADRVVVMDEGQILCVGTPPEIGEELKKRNHEMFLAMPVPMQVYAKVESEQPCPITVRDGRKWLDIVCKKKGISPANASSSYRKESDSQKGKSSFAKITEKFTEKKEDIILACDDLWFRYDKELPDVVKGLSFFLKRGEFFALLGGNESYNVTGSRYQGFLDAHHELGIPVDENLIFMNVDNQLVVSEAVSKLYAAGADGIVCMDDVICSMCMSSLREKKIQVPAQIKAASMYDSKNLEYHNPPVTSIKFDAVRLGKMACTKLLKILGENPQEEITPLNYQVVLRESTQ